MLEIHGNICANVCAIARRNGPVRDKGIVVDRVSQDTTKRLTDFFGDEKSCWVVYVSVDVVCIANDREETHSKDFQYRNLTSGMVRRLR